MRVISIVESAAIVFDNKYMGGDLIDEVAIVCDKQHGSVEVAQGGFESISSPEVEVIGGFVEHHQVGVGGGNLRQCGLALFSTTAVAERLQSDVAGESEAGEQAADLSGRHIGLSGWSDDFDEIDVSGDCFESLVEVGNVDVVPQFDSAAVGFELSDQCFEQRGLAAAVGPQDPQSLASFDSQRQVLKQRFREPLGDLECFDHDFSTAGGLAEGHGWDVEVVELFDVFESFEFSDPVGGLFVFLPVLVLADEVLGPGDEVLLSPGDLAEPFLSLGSLCAVGGEVAGVGVESIGSEFEDACDDLVEEEAVVADEDHRRSGSDQERFEPFGCGDVEVIGGFIEQHHIGIGEQDLGQ